MLVDKNDKNSPSRANLRRLRELTDLLDRQNHTENDTVNKLNNLIKDAKKTIDKISCGDTKLKCYETLLTAIAAMVDNTNNT